MREVFLLRGGKMNKNITGYILTGLFAMGTGALVSWAYFNSVDAEKEKFPGDMALYNECREIISEKGDPEFDNIEAMNGWLEAGGDKYTYYYNEKGEDPVLVMTNYVNMSGTAKASGFQVAYFDKGDILLTAVEEGLAADRAGLKKGDIITAINGVSVIEEGYTNIVSKMMGKQDSTVTLDVERNGEKLTIDFVRDNEYIREVKWELKGDVMYVLVESMADFTDSYVAKAIDELNTEKLIIDLRDNPGGDGDTAMSLGGLFLTEGYVVKDNFGRSTQRIDIADDGVVFDGEIVILINEKTASASEVFTALMMQYHDKVTVVGTTSFGKGIYQQSEELSDGGILNYTAGYYYVGEWDNFHGKGINPDIEVKMERELIGTEDDIQLKKALELLK
ncbi:MAG: PDZ domain-containing protein [Ruminococcus sp.]|nr:PDZ domain-containing protein [Ruminococcus sp.]